MKRSTMVCGVLMALALGHVIGPTPALCDGEENRVAIAMDETTFITVKDYDEWENVHLYKLEDGRILLIDSVTVRHDPQVDRIIEFRRIPIEKQKP